MDAQHIFLKMKLVVICTLALAVIPVHSKLEDAQFWKDSAKLTLQKALHRERTLNTNVAKNVVIFVGDGMGISTVTAARIFKGQQAGMPGEETVLKWEEFSDVALSKTYGVDKQVVSSGAASTAIFCGTKTNDAVIGLDANALMGNCESSKNNTAEDSFLVLANRAGKATGFVTTSRVTHATPAGFYAHVPNRYWESDADIPAEEASKGCKDTGSQLAENGHFFKVVLGGGRRELTTINMSDPEYPSKVGKRKDGRNIIDEWLSNKPADRSKYVWNLQDFNNVNPNDTDNLIGLFERSHMSYELDRKDDTAGEPSIAQMVEKAIKILQKDPDGFILAVEGARIDHAHHDGNAKRALVDTLAMEEAVAKVMELTNEEDTLVIVTADHSHAFTLGTYPSRGNPILGLYDEGISSDGMPYTSLGYADGPGGEVEKDSYLSVGTRRNLTTVNTGDDDFKQPAIVPRDSESHGGEDVAIYANGPMSHLFHGVHEQNYIAYAVRYAACLDADEPCAANSAPPCGRFSLLVIAMNLAFWSYF